ncbi:hypothetical protein BJV78DRAFT_1225204 [Lactifluus subvellereus]|nr:hypothetical protein BJV78DRAFT_1225204 [Lactifluus subvellereus]
MAAGIWVTTLSFTLPWGFRNKSLYWVVLLSTSTAHRLFAKPFWWSSGTTTGYPTVTINRADYPGSLLETQFFLTKGFLPRRNTPQQVQYKKRTNYTNGMVLSVSAGLLISERHMSVSPCNLR